MSMIISKSGLNPEAPSFVPHSVTTTTTTTYYYINHYYPPQLPHLINTNLFHDHFYHHHLSHNNQQQPNFVYYQYPSPPPPPPPTAEKISIIKGQSHRDGMNKRNNNGKQYYLRQSTYANSTNGEKQFVKKKIINSSSLPSWKLKKTVSVKYDGNFTTVMIKNIPIKYTRELLVNFVEEYCMASNLQQDGEDDFTSAFDFLYLPIDFSTRMNKGYAFVNFTDPRAVWKFKLSIDGKAWPLFQSRKQIAVVYARIQGKEELRKRFEGMMYPYEDYMPLYFTSPHPLIPHHHNDSSKAASSLTPRTSTIGSNNEDQGTVEHSTSSSSS